MGLIRYCGSNLEVTKGAVHHPGRQQDDHKCAFFHAVDHSLLSNHWHFHIVPAVTQKAALEFVHTIRTDKYQDLLTIRLPQATQVGYKSSWLGHLPDKESIMGQLWIQHFYYEGQYNRRTASCLEMADKKVVLFASW